MSLAAPPGAPPQVHLRPLGVGELLDAAIKVVARNAGTLLRLTLLVVVPLQLVVSLVALSTLPDGYDPTSFETQTTVEGETTMASDLVATLLTFLMLVLVATACLQAIGEAYLGGRADRRRSLGFGLRRLHSSLWIALLSSGPLLACFVLPIVAPSEGAAVAALVLAFFGVWLAVGFALAAPALFVEGVKGRQALRRSWRLIKKRWWATFGRLLLGALLVLVISLIVQVAIALPLFVGVDDFSLAGVLLSAVAGIVSNAITLPFLVALLALTYFDLRVRREGLDLELLAHGLGAEAGAPAPAPAAPPAAAPPAAPPAAPSAAPPAAPERPYGGEWLPPQAPGAAAGREG